MDLPDPVAYARQLNEQQLRNYQRSYQENSREWLIAERELARRRRASVWKGRIGAARNVWLDVRRGWSTVVVVGVALALVSWLSARDAAFWSTGGTPETATIVSFRHAGADDGSVVVVARMSNGAYVARRVAGALLAGCKVGDPISGIRVRNELRLGPAPCTPGSNPQALSAR